VNHGDAVLSVIVWDGDDLELHASIVVPCVDQRIALLDRLAPLHHEPDVRNANAMPARRAGDANTPSIVIDTSMTVNALRWPGTQGVSAPPTLAVDADNPRRA
jgi:hypothetical protein